MFMYQHVQNPMSEGHALGNASELHLAFWAVLCKHSPALQKKLSKVLTACCLYCGHRCPKFEASVVATAYVSLGPLQLHLLFVSTHTCESLPGASSTKGTIVSGEKAQARCHVGGQACAVRPTAVLCHSQHKLGCTS